MELSVVTFTFIVLATLFKLHSVATIKNDDIEDLTNSDDGVQSSKNFYYGNKTNCKQLCKCLQAVEGFPYSRVKLITDVEVGKAKSGAVVMCYENGSRAYFALTNYLFFYIKVLFNHRKNEITSYLDEINFHEDYYSYACCEKLKGWIWKHIDSDSEYNEDENDDDESEEENGDDETVFSSSREHYNYRLENCLTEWRLAANGMEPGGDEAMVNADEEGSSDDEEDSDYEPGTSDEDDESENESVASEDEEESDSSNDERSD